MVICLERNADLHMAQLMPLPLTVSCFCKIQIGFTFLVPAHPGSPGQRAVKRVCVCLFHQDKQLTYYFTVCTCKIFSKLIILCTEKHYALRLNWWMKKGLGRLISLAEAGALISLTALTLFYSDRKGIWHSSL